MKSRTALVLFIAGILILCAGHAFGKYSGGTGEPNDPYQIASKADLLAMAADTNDYSKCFILTADIDLDPNLAGGQVFAKAIIAPNTNNSMGFGGTAFTGTFDGNGHKITNITIDGGSNSYLGLFGYSDGSSVENIGIENCSIIGDSNSGFVGGLVGHNNGNISNCYSTGSINCHSYVGGLVGANVGEVNIINCHSTVTIGGYMVVGGLAGDNSDGDITNCYSTGSVNGSSFIGGFVGDNWGNINNCYSTGTVSGSLESQNIGGFVGSNGDSITNCYSTGSACGFVVGGLVGWNSWSIACSYSTGMVSGSLGSQYAGGLVGINGYGGSVVSSFWDKDTSKQTASAAGTALSTSQMKQQGSFTGWDFLGGAANDANDYWRMCANGVDYPRLSWEFVKGGDFSCPDGVNMDDLLRLSLDWLKTYEQALYGADADGDSSVSFADFTILAKNWLKN